MEMGDGGGGWGFLFLSFGGAAAFQRREEAEKRVEGRLGGCIDHHYCCIFGRQMY
jgi:MYXO-CTERM domain-containing protein